MKIIIKKFLLLFLLYQFLYQKYEKVGSFFLYKKIDSNYFNKNKNQNEEQKAKIKLIKKKNNLEKTYEQIEEEKKILLDSFPYIYHLGFYYEDV